MAGCLASRENPVSFFATATSRSASFEPQDIVTQTPHKPTLCPSKDPGLSTPDLSQYTSESSLTRAILDFLNSGGNQLLLKVVLSADLTNDGVDEVILIAEDPSSALIAGIMYVIGCDRGQYKVLSTIKTVYEYYPHILTIKDMNLNGVPELVVTQMTCHYCTSIWVYEWNGHEFQSLVRFWRSENNQLTYDDAASTVGLGEAEIRDIDGNGTYEVILSTVRTGHADELNFGPWRSEVQIYMWDGQYFSFNSWKYSLPEYRFQAVQDGDKASIDGDYETSQSLYEDVIYSSTLKSWSSEIGDQLIAQAEAWMEGKTTPTPLPPNPRESHQLAAYARYRLMLLYYLLGRHEEAQIEYDKLQMESPVGNEGYPYFEMATLFWQEYKNSYEMGRACGKAVDFATAHPEILTPLNGPLSSFWNRTYTPVDVCPFDSNGRSVQK